MKLKTKQRAEIMADLIFFIVPALISFLAVFIFDIHWSFYEEPYFPLKFIFTTIKPYLVGTLLGGIAGFFLLKLAAIGFIEEEKVLKR